VRSVHVNVSPHQIGAHQPGGRS